jgi:hypothetical protein
MKKRYKIISSLVIGCHILCGQSQTKRYSPKEVQEDYKKIFTLLEAVHTGLFDYPRREEWESLKNSTLLVLSQPTTEREFSII